MHADQTRGAGSRARGLSPCRTRSQAGEAPTGRCGGSGWPGATQGLLPALGSRGPSPSPCPRTQWSGRLALVAARRAPGLSSACDSAGKLRPGVGRLCADAPRLWAPASLRRGGRRGPLAPAAGMQARGGAEQLPQEELERVCACRTPVRALPYALQDRRCIRCVPGRRGRRGRWGALASAGRAFRAPRTSSQAAAGRYGAGRLVATPVAAQGTRGRTAAARRGTAAGPGLRTLEGGTLRDRG